MLTESVILTALPAGVDRDQGVARVTCFVTLRASGDEDVLDAASSFLDWPDVLSRALERLVVEVDGAGELPTRVVSGATGPRAVAGAVPSVDAGDPPRAGALHAAATGHLRRAHAARPRRRAPRRRRRGLAVGDPSITGHAGAAGGRRRRVGSNARLRPDPSRR